MTKSASYFYSLLRWGGPTALVAIAIALQLALPAVVGSRAFIMLYPAVFIGSLIGTFPACLFATTIASAAAWGIFISGTSTGPVDLVALAIFFATGVFANLLGRRLRIGRVAQTFKDQARVFDTALSSSPDFHYIFDTNHRFIYVNQALLKLWGKTLDEAVGKNFEDLGYPPELVSLHEGQLNEVLKGKTVRGDNAFTAPDGSKGYYEYVFIPVFDSLGAVQAISGTTRDVTLRMAAEESRLTKQRLDLQLVQARENEAQFRTLANSIPQLAWIARPNGEIFWYNDRWYDYTGTTPKQMEGWGWESVHDLATLPEVKKRWSEAIASGQKFEMEFPLRSAAGELRWFLTRAEPICDAAGFVQRWFGTNTDIDDQKRAEGALKRAITTRDEFLSIASHELKTPLTSLKLQIQLTQRNLDARTGKAPPAEKLVRVFDVQARQVDRLHGLIEELLDDTRIQTGKLDLNFEEFDLAELARDVMSRFGEELKGIGVEANVLAPHSLLITGDRARIEQVITNLVTNAMKYGKGQPFEVRVARTETHARVEVTDSGMGIADDKVDKIFGRFERAISSNNISGLGLGLYIAKEIVEQHHGEISVRSRLDEGSTFTVELPLSHTVARELHA